MNGNYIDFERPPVLRGTTEQNIDSLYHYMQRLSSQLTEGINASGENDVSSVPLIVDDLKSAVQELKAVSAKMMACTQTMSRLADVVQQGGTEPAASEMEGNNNVGV